MDPGRKALSSLSVVHEPRRGHAVGATASGHNRFAVSSSVIRPRGSQRDKKVSPAKAPPKREITHRSD